MISILGQDKKIYESYNVAMETFLAKKREGWKWHILLYDLLFKLCFSAKMCQYSCLDNGVCEVLYTGPPRYVRKSIARELQRLISSTPYLSDISVSQCLFNGLKGRDALPNGMNFRKIPNGLWPSLFFSENYIAIFLRKPSKESPIDRSNIWFLDWNWW